VICIVQARINSSRLPGKILLNGFNKPLLVHLIERLKKSNYISNIVLAASKNKLDNILSTICKQINIDFFQGSENDVLSRFFYCSRKFKGKIIVRITSDCPLIDCRLVDETIKAYLNNKVDYISALHNSKKLDGFDVEVFSFEALRKSFIFAKKNNEREHVTPYMYNNIRKFKIAKLLYPIHKKFKFNTRLTLDYIEDYYLIFYIIQNLYNKKKFFNINDILNLLSNKKKLLKINQKYIKENSFNKKLKKIKLINYEKNTLKKLDGLC
jgi:spore coat polysaccharide biosynthesis protein SpsF